MSYHTVVYNLAAAAAGATNSDMLAAVDSEFTQRGSHYTLTERFRLLAAALVGVSVTRGRFQVPKWNAFGEMVIFNANRALQPPANPQWDLYGPYMPELPLEEEIQVQASNNLGAATEQESCILQLAPDSWTGNLERGEMAMMIRATATITPTLNAWSGPNAITLSQSLQGGSYAIVGTIVQGTNAVAYRWIFPRNRMYKGRRLRPGGLTQTALGDVTANQPYPWLFHWGTQGAFHTFELPQIEVFGTLAGAITYQIFIAIVRLGDGVAGLERYVAGGS